MAQLRQQYEQYVARDTIIIVIGPENAAAFQAYFQAEHLPFTGLPDPELSVLKRYDQEVNLFRLGRMPAQIVVDKQGIARYAHYGHSMSDIPDSADVFTVLDELNKN